MKKSTYDVIGVMAGSSMDGLDIVHVEFTYANHRWNFTIKRASTFPYHGDLKSRLANAPKQELSDQQLLDIEFGEWIADRIVSFCPESQSLDLLAVHGHTVIHTPEKGVSWQLGRGDIIAKKCGVTTIADFRNEDIKWGGQGAPLVPFGDFHLFADFDACINLGGICNISVQRDQTAWDIAPCNQVLNYFANQLGFEYDADGALAAEGKVDPGFYAALSALDYFKKSPPKSLPNNFIDEAILAGVHPKDGLTTYCCFLAKIIGQSVPKQDSKILVTGGGTHNIFLMKRIQGVLSGCEIDSSDHKLVDFKEAIIFAFLGIKRLRGEINVIGSTTGASKDTSSGVIHLPE